MAKYSGLFGNVPTEQLMGQPQPRSGGFFGQGGGGRAIAGSIGDALLQMAHMQPIYAPTMQAQQKAALEDAQWTRRQQSELANQQAMYDYKLAHPEPVNNDTINDVKWYMGATPQEKAAYDALHPVYKIGPDGLPYPMARSAAPPTAPVGKLTPIPEGGAGGPPSGAGFP